MAMDFEADFSVMLDADEFAEVATFTPAGWPHPSSKSVCIDVIHEMAYVEVGNVSGYRPVASGTTAEFEGAGIGVGARVTIKTVSYTVIEPQPDGTGLTMLVLQRA